MNVYIVLYKKRQSKVQYIIIINANMFEQTDRLHGLQVYLVPASGFDNCLFGRAVRLILCYTTECILGIFYITGTTVWSN